MTTSSIGAITIAGASRADTGCTAHLQDQRAAGVVALDDPDRFDLREYRREYLSVYEAHCNEEPQKKGFEKYLSPLTEFYKASAYYVGSGRVWADNIIRWFGIPPIRRLRLPQRLLRRLRRRSTDG